MQRVFLLPAICAAILVATTHPAFCAGTPAGTVISSECTVSYLDGDTSVTASSTESVTVAPTAGVALQIAPAPESVLPGQSYYVLVESTNAGNTTDSIALHAVSAHGWNTVLIRDDNNDRVHQSTETVAVTSTVPLSADTTHQCFLRVTVPPSATTGDTITVTGMSTFAPAMTALAAVSFPTPVAHIVSFTQDPTLSPSAVASGGSAYCSASAADSLGHEISYAWSDGGAGGTFSPSASTQNPVYAAPANLSGSDITVSLTCTATCSQGTALAKPVLPDLTVYTVPHTVSFTQAPAVSPGAVSSGGATQCTADVADSLGHEIFYTWSDGGAGGTFSPSASSLNPAYTAPANSSGSDIAVNLTCTATCSQGTALAKPVSPGLIVYTAVPPEFDPNEASAWAGGLFETPHIVLNDPHSPTSVSFTIGVPDGISLDTTEVRGSLACIQNGSDAGTLTAGWDPAARTISVTATILTPAQRVEVVKSIAMTVATGTDAPQLTIDGNSALSIQLANPMPGDFNCDGLVNATDVALFNQEWLRWHRLPLPSFDPATDGIFDLGPRSIGIWPNWTPISDGAIHIVDATAFVECCTGSRNELPTYIGPVQTVRTSTLIQVTVPSAPYGVYQVSITLPNSMGFDPAIDGSGNLRHVYRGVDAGTLLYSEFDAASRKLWLTGSVVGKAPYQIGSIYLSR